MAIDIELKDCVLYRYKGRIKEKRTHCIECCRQYQAEIGGAADNKRKVLGMFYKRLDPESSHHENCQGSEI